MKFELKPRKKDKTRTVLIIVLVIGICLILYPSVANFWNQMTQTGAIASYEESLTKLTKKDYTDFKNQAEDYNRKLSGISCPLAHFESIPGYADLLNVNKNGMMGYISIDKIKVELPIYHGTSQEVLNVAVGHLQGSSLPVGGKGTHSVLTGHRGMPGAILFTDLDQLNIGDTFTIDFLDQRITYEIDQICIVLPKETDQLKIDPDQDYCTLMTCTPYGVNTHRILVRGVRIFNIKNKPLLHVTNESKQIHSLIVAPALGIPMLAVYFTAVFVHDKKKREARKK
ncbi:MAG: class C sortase [Erysipelotrichaceae bacterium]|nr:class C sortase [Erysipelotrichaceae bacterium]